MVSSVNEDAPEIKETLQSMYYFDVPLFYSCATLHGSNVLPTTISGEFSFVSLNFTTVTATLAAEPFLWRVTSTNFVDYHFACLLFNFTRISPDIKLLARASAVDAFVNKDSSLPSSSIVWGFLKVDFGSLDSTGVTFLVPRKGASAAVCFGEPPNVNLGSYQLLECLASNPGSYQQALLFDGQTTNIFLGPSRIQFLNSAENYDFFTPTVVQENLAPDGTSPTASIVYFGVDFPILHLFNQEYSISTYNFLVNLFLGASTSFSAFRVVSTVMSWFFHWYTNRLDIKRSRFYLFHDIPMQDMSKSNGSQLLEQPLLSESQTQQRSMSQQTS